MLDSLQSFLNQPDRQPQIIGLAAFLCASIVAYLLFAWSSHRRRAIQHRMDAMTGSDDGTKEVGFWQSISVTVGRLASCLLPGDEAKRSQLQQRMLHAGLYDRSAAQLFLIVRLLMMVLPVPLAILASTSGLIERKGSLIVGAVAGGIGMLLPSLWLDRRKARRQLVLERSFPDFLDLLVTCLESGLSLDAALRRVTSELRHAHPVLAVEMDRVQSEMDLGSSPDAALHNLAERTDLDTIHTLGTFIHQARRYGTSIGEALRTHGEMLRTQREQRAEEIAQKAAVKVLFPTLLFIFPAVFVVLAGPAAIQLQEHFAQHQTEQAKQPKKK